VPVRTRTVLGCEARRRSRRRRLGFPADLTDSYATRAAADYISQQFGTVDVIVHSAGGNRVLETPVEYADPLEAIAHDWSLNKRRSGLMAGSFPQVD
jgi:3-oxoacyl-[acyl-carrier protein] reductase